LGLLDKNLNVSYTLYGTNSSNLSGNISRDSSPSTSQQTTHNNTNLTATNINLNTTQDTKREDVKVLTVYVDLSVICVGLEVRTNNSGGFVWSIKVCISNGWGYCQGCD
jgi:outer membrane usher protein FimD/PapC